MSQSDPNVWRAWSKKYNEPHYFVGHYDPLTRLFWREPKASETMRNPELEIIAGTFSDMAQHTRVGKDNYHSARVMAYYYYNRSLKADVPDDAILGEDYGLLRSVIV